MGWGRGLVSVAPPIVALLECTTPLILFTSGKLGTDRVVKAELITRSENKLRVGN